MHEYVTIEANAWMDQWHWVLAYHFKGSAKGSKPGHIGSSPSHRPVDQSSEKKKINYRELPVCGHQTTPQYPCQKGPSYKKYPSDVVHLQPTQWFKQLSQ